MKYIMIICCVCCMQQIQAQELFVFTEPASNMPSKSLGIRTMNGFMSRQTGGTNYHLMPELMWGINKKWMAHAQGFFSSRNTGGLQIDGASVYAKYRFYSADDLHSHFRMAAYGRFSMNKSAIMQQEIETMGFNSGYELGIIATQLLHKVAISSSVSFEKALDNGSANKFPISEADHAFNYTLSAGKLMLPKSYSTYSQTNLNVMVELLGQRLNGNGKSYLDIAPSVQLIINSQARIDIGYRKELYSTMQRMAPNGVILKLEYTLFNVFK
jgi:hypothetical protein